MLLFFSQVSGFLFLFLSTWMHQRNNPSTLLLSLDLSRGLKTNNERRIQNSNFKEMTPPRAQKNNDKCFVGPKWTVSNRIKQVRDGTFKS